MRKTAVASQQLCAVVVTFRPDEQIVSRLEMILVQVDHIYIVDNKSDPVTISILNNFCLLHENATLIANDVNKGLGTALNIGIQAGIKCEFSLYSTFDQDSVVASSYSSSMLALMESISDNRIILGCNYWDARKQINRFSEKSAVLPAKPRKTVITSGMMFSRDVYEAVGTFREDYFIDSIDHEYCLRARTQGHRIYLHTNPLMSHEIGEKLNQKYGFFKPLAFNHKPIRKYYMTRNTILTLKQYWHSDFSWSSMKVGGMVLELISILIFERDKAPKLVAFKLGLFHGIKGTTGELDESINEFSNT